MLRRSQEISSRPGKSSTNGRRVSDWINQYLRYAKDTEPPTAFHQWTGIGCIASALQRRVYMRWGMETIRPNLYIVLLGPAAATRKSTALMMGRELVRAINIPMIGQDNSPEAVIREIKSNVNTYHEGPMVRFQSAVTCFASELAVFLGRQNTEFQAYLTDWYDSPDEWKRTTKHQGVDDITGLCFNLVGAMAPDWIPHIFLPESIGGGFTSRIVFVPESKKAKTIVNPNKVEPTNGLKDDLLHDLEMISSMVGEYHFSDDAERFYEEWYAADDAKIQDGKFPISDGAFHTYCGRRGTLIKKVSMCVAASRRQELVIEEEDIRYALESLETIEARMPGTFAAVGRAKNSYQSSLVEKIVSTRKSVKKSQLIRELYQDITLEDIDMFENTMLAGKMVRVTRLTEESDTLYEWLG